MKTTYGKVLVSMLTASLILFGLLVLIVKLDGPIETVDASPETTSEVTNNVETVSIAPGILSLLPTGTLDCGESDSTPVIPTIDPSGFHCTWKSGNELPNQRYCGKISRTYTDDEGTNYVCCVEDCIHDFMQCTDGTVHDLSGHSCGPLHPEVCYPANN